MAKRNTKTAPAGAITVDAARKRLGAIASRVAFLLMGKHEPTFSRHNPIPHHVHVTNISKLDIPARRAQRKTYLHYSGYPSGLKVKTLAQVRAQKGNARLLEDAVWGMLPKNRQRRAMMKRLTIEQ